MNALEKLESTIATLRRDVPTVRVGGMVSEVTPTHFRVSGLSRYVRLGELIGLEIDKQVHLGEVVRIDTDGVTAKPFDSHFAAGLGVPAFRMPPKTLSPHPAWKGRVINALGEPLDGAGDMPVGEREMQTDANPPPAMSRSRVSKPLRTGVRVVDLFTPLCIGQRIGIFAGSGVGKTTLLSMLARSAGFDTVVTALVGERGREVREFLEESLVHHKTRAITVVSTSDESPMMRRLAPKTAMTIAEYFRDRGESVLLIVDSVTRFAHASREVALATGEPAIARGYAPSVFSELPRLLERSGPGLEGQGSITGVFAVLVDGDDHNEPVADTVRGTLDGHIMLDRDVADQGRYPAVNVLSSVSRLGQHVWSPEEANLVRKLRAMIARFEDTRDLRLMGGYQPGRDSELDQAVQLVPKIYDVLQQHPTDPSCAEPFQELLSVIKTAIG
ncbi:flagellar protein export ATPase FliI [Tardiphaga sp. 20_F10_N6_6]|jgi:flagellum-specific ATP synthase|uniref:flagellar protein export ATPase FliI n=1 Tax=unclassified Tardiphaga TaxID=2631404 RepID=UPI0008A7C564|nr:MULTISPECIES: flagellar protein export ATPase FliI [unclassified Tardiphaga]UFS75438.1 flagellar protein export ATPase FliI [Tardiphaga sp. 37S4]WPO42076.1 flagellar protein export ATPase FliI [Tardiphaga sp. 42S5]SEH76381.1 flagellum-specific ATP synthase [Tardiphaga sp. OK245]SNS53416.1 flagellum-specific ATP synthase [Tardiphaga sp. OK246]